MQCPSCKEHDNKVIDSRLTEGGAAIRRRRICQSCGRRFTTKERVEEDVRLMVVKSGGQRVPYSRDKIRNGINRACVKLDIAEDRIQRLVDRVEAEMFAQHDREVHSDVIGRCVGKHLRRLNPVAYVRFMSVYRKFNSVDAFIDEITDVRRRAAQESPPQQILFDYGDGAADSADSR